MKIIGITGPTGSGKSVLTEHLKKKGYPCIDADEVYHSMLIPPSPCLDAIRKNFGDEVFTPDGSLDRAALGSVVFNVPQKLELLNSTVLGIVIDRIRQTVNELKSQGHSAVIIDAPTLIESGFHKECDAVISIIAPVEDRIQRIQKRDDISLEKARARVMAQKDDGFYESNSHHTIYNDKDIESFTENIKEIEAFLN